MQHNEIIVVPSNLTKHVVSNNPQVDITRDDLAHHITGTLKPHLEPWQLGDAGNILTWVGFIYRQLAILLVVMLVAW